MMWTEIFLAIAVVFIFACVRVCRTLGNCCRQKSNANAVVDQTPRTQTPFCSRENVEQWSSNDVARFFVANGPLCEGTDDDDDGDGDDIDANSVWARLADYAQQHAISGLLLVANSSRPEDLQQLFGGLRPPLETTDARAVIYVLRKGFGELHPTTNDSSTRPSAVDCNAGGPIGTAMESRPTDQTLNQLQARIKNLGVELSKKEAALEAARLAAEKSTREWSETVAKLQAELEEMRDKERRSAVTANNNTKMANIVENFLQHNFSCPITMDVLVDPVQAGDHVFERAAIEAWLESNESHPLSRKPLAKTDLKRAQITCEQLRSLEAAILAGANRRLMVADPVEICGLVDQAKYNGRTGIIKHWDESRQRWAVDIQSRSLKFLRSANLTRVLPVPPWKKTQKHQNNPRTTGSIAMEESFRHSNSALRQGTDTGSGGGGGGAAQNGQFERVPFGSNSSEWDSSALVEAMRELNRIAAQPPSPNSVSTSRVPTVTARDEAARLIRVAAAGEDGGGEGARSHLHQFECPAGHTLTPFMTPNGRFHCDLCKEPIRQGQAMQGCRACDFDMCLTCTGEEARHRRALAEQFQF